MNPIFQDKNSPEVEQILSALAKITKRSPDEIQPYLNEFLDLLATQEENLNLSSLSQIAHEEWSVQFHQWIDSHKNRHIPVLSEEAMSRESMYPDRW